MGFIQENIIELNIGLPREYKLIHFSDVHLVTSRDNDTKEVIEEAEKAEELWYRQRTWFADKANEKYSDEHMIPSKDCLANIINYINEEKPNGVIATGDIIDYYSDSNYDLLLEQFGNLNYPFVFSCGNHETPASRYQELTMSEDDFMVLEFPDFKIIALDNSTKKVSKETLNKVRKELRSKKPAIISMHIPVSTQYNREIMSKYDPYFVIYDNDTDLVTKEFIELLITNDKVKALLCGHVHGRSESYFAPGKMQCCASSGLIGLINKIIVK